MINKLDIIRIKDFLDTDIACVEEDYVLRNCSLVSIEDTDYSSNLSFKTLNKPNEDYIKVGKIVIIGNIVYKISEGPYTLVEFDDQPSDSHYKYIIKVSPVQEEDFIATDLLKSTQSEIKYLCDVAYLNITDSIKLVIFDHSKTTHKNYGKVLNSYLFLVMDGVKYRIARKLHTTGHDRSYVVLETKKEVSKSTSSIKSYPKIYNVSNGLTEIKVAFISKDYRERTTKIRYDSSDEKAVSLNDIIRVEDDYYKVKSIAYNYVRNSYTNIIARYICDPRIDYVELEAEYIESRN